MRRERGIDEERKRVRQRETERETEMRRERKIDRERYTQTQRQRERESQIRGENKEIGEQVIQKRGITKTDTELVGVISAALN